MGFGDTQASKPCLVSDSMLRLKVKSKSVIVLPIDTPAPPSERYLKLPGIPETGLAKFFGQSHGKPEIKNKRGKNK
jgi:hypothetical protein